MVIFAERNGRHVHHAQVSCDHLIEGDLVELNGVGIHSRIFGEHAVDTAVGSLEHDLGFDLGGALRGGGVGGEVGVTHASREDHHAALFEVTNRASANVRLGHLVPVYCRHHPRRPAVILNGVLQREGVDHGTEHAHKVRVRAIHPSHRASRAAPNVAATNHDGEFESATLHGGGDLAG